MADTDTPRTALSLHLDGKATVRRLVTETVMIQYGDETTLFFTSAGLDRLTDAISTFRASEAQAEAA